VSQNPERKAELERILTMMVKHGASDLHLKAGGPPLFRISGLIRKTDAQTLSGDQIEGLIFSILPEKHIQKYLDTNNLDFAYGLAGAGRFRIHVYRQRGSTSVAIRQVSTQIPSFQQLHLPPSVANLGRFEHGLVLIAGAAGTGKSTTLAALVDVINKTRHCHIFTVEDPIEYLHRDDKAFVNQREVGLDVESFHEALKYFLRADPDVILIGEMRDSETFEAALVSAETGHLVLGTIHSPSAPQTIPRILEYFPTDQHSQIRQLLRFNLQAVLVQKLLRGARADLPLVPATELMFCNPTIRKMIGDGEFDKIPIAMRSAATEGMHDFNMSLVELVKKGLVTRDVAMAASPNPNALDMNIKGIYLDSDKGSITSI